MLNALTGLVIYQFVGELIARGTGLPLPGPVIGMVLLLASLVVREHRGRPSADPELRNVTQGLLGNLALLFVPAGVGVVTQLNELREAWLPLVVSIVVSTFLGLLVTGWIMQRLASRSDK